MRAYIREVQGAYRGVKLKGMHKWAHECKLRERILIEWERREGNLRGRHTRSNGGGNTRCVTYSRAPPEEVRQWWRWVTGGGGCGRCALTYLEGEW